MIVGDTAYTARGRVSCSAVLAGKSRAMLCLLGQHGHSAGTGDSLSFIECFTCRDPCKWLIDRGARRVRSGSVCHRICTLSHRCWRHGRRCACLILAVWYVVVNMLQTPLRCVTKRHIIGATALSWVVHLHLPCRLHSMYCRVLYDRRGEFAASSELADRSLSLIAMWSSTLVVGYMPI